MEKNIIDIAELKKGVKAGVALAASENFDHDLYKKNCEKAAEWAEMANLESTAGNVLVLGTIASFRTLLGDELFDTPVVDEDGNFCEEIMEQVKDTLLATMGLRMNGDELEEIHDEPTAE
jgi:predicted house-cleaning noncanonical NTP pyrophosphatase (MazG superfamily)